MRIILKHKNMKDKYLITSDSRSYTVSKVLLDDKNEPKLDKNGKIKTSTSDEWHPTKVEYLLDSLYQRILRKNDATTKEEFLQHVIETKKIIKDFSNEFRLGDIDER